MKIDYPDVKNPDGVPFVRLYEFRSDEARKLKQAFESLAMGELKQVNLRDVTDIISVDGTELSFTRDTTDKGVVRLGRQQFDFSMSPKGWLDVAELTDVFSEITSPSGFQWLAERTLSRIDVLLSPGGDW